MERNFSTYNEFYFSLETAVEKWCRYEIFMREMNFFEIVRSTAVF